MESLFTGIKNLSDFLWGGTWGDYRILPIGVLTVLLLGSGIYMMGLLGGRPLRRLLPALREVWEGRHAATNTKGAITPWQALFTGLSGQVGTGNLAGVATAITLGGPGAIFWMWVTAILGMALSFAESSLAVRFRRIDESGRVYGGPMYYIRYGLGKKWSWLAIVFCVGTVFSAVATGGMIQSNSIVHSVQNASAGMLDFLPCRLTVPSNENLRIRTDGTERLANGCDLSGQEVAGELVLPAIADAGARTPSADDKVTMLNPALIGLFVSALVFAVIVGGIKSIGRVAGFLVPGMALFYCIIAFATLVLHIQELPAALGMIFKGAFGLDQAVGGFTGGMLAMAIRAGVARGLFSNEAGQGSTPIAHAAARTDDPVCQGEIAMIGVFIDTIVICTMTALVILCVPGEFINSAGETVRYAWQADNLEASAITTAAYRHAFTGGEWIVAVTLLLFAFTTIIGWTYYAEQAISYLTGGRGVLLFRYVWVIVIFIGSLQEVSLVWKLGDIANASMVLPNLLAVLALSGTVAAMHHGRSKKQ